MFFFVVLFCFVLFCFVFFLLFFFFFFFVFVLFFFLSEGACTVRILVKKIFAIMKDHLT